jgi:hypothetical protein
MVQSVVVLLVIQLLFSIFLDFLCIYFESSFLFIDVRGVIERLEWRRLVPVVFIVGALSCNILVPAFVSSVAGVGSSAPQGSPPTCS